MIRQVESVESTVKIFEAKDRDKLQKILIAHYICLKHTRDINTDLT